MNTSFKEKVILILLSGATLLAVLNWSSIYGAIQQLLGSMNSLFIGAIFAFILNVPMKKLEDQFEKISFLKKSKRSLAIVGVLIGFALIVTGLVVIVLPTLVTTVSELVSVSSTAIPKSVNALTNFLESNGLLSGQIGDQIASFWIS